MKKLILFIFGIILLLLLMISLGLFSKYNWFTANRAIKENHFIRVFVNEDYGY